MTIRPYNVGIAQFTNVSVSAIQDLFEFVAPSDSVVSIDEILWSQTNLSVASEVLRTTLQKISGSPTSGSSGSSADSHSVLGDGAASTGVTIEKNNTTVLSGGTVELTQPMNVQSRAYDYKIVLQESIVLSPGQYFVWRLEEAPTDTLTLSASIKYSEYGG